MDVTSVRPTDMSAMFETVRSRKSRIASKDGHFIFVDSNDGYDIPICSCQTYEGILRWVVHLSNKDWADCDLIAQFVDQATDAAGLDIYAA